MVRTKTAARKNPPTKNSKQARMLAATRKKHPTLDEAPVHSDSDWSIRDLESSSTEEEEVGGEDPPAQTEVQQTRGGSDDEAEGSQDSGGENNPPQRQPIFEREIPADDERIAYHLQRPSRMQRGASPAKDPSESKLYYNDAAEQRYIDWLGRDHTVTKVLKPRYVNSLSLGYVLDYFKPSHLDKLITLDFPTYKDALHQFYANLGQNDQDMHQSRVCGVVIPVNKVVINEVLGCPWVKSSDLRPWDPNGPYEVFHDYEWPNVADLQPIDPLEMGRQYFDIKGTKPGRAVKYNVDLLSVEHRLVLDWICLNVLPSGGHSCEPSIANIMLFYYLVKGLSINPDTRSTST